MEFKVGLTAFVIFIFFLCKGVEGLECYSCSNEKCKEDSLETIQSSGTEKCMTETSTEGKK